MGKYDSATNTIKFRGKHKDPVTGKEMRTRSELDMSKPNRHTFNGWTTPSGGKEYKSMEGVTEKK